MMTLSKDNKELIASIGISLIFALVIFAIVQGFFIDLVDEFILRDLDYALIKQSTLLNFVIFNYMMIIYLSFGLTSIVTIKEKNTYFIFVMALISSIALMYAISYVALKIMFPDLIGANLFIVSPSFFMTHVIGNTFYFFLIQIGIFILMYAISLYVFR